MTSGATLAAAARSLRRAGAAHIAAVVFARAERGA
jgi:predicted amidophosphoribosyltransferase